MARVTADKISKTQEDLLRAARAVLREHGFSGLSTRRVADAANTQMSQIRYHFGSKEGLILALFTKMNADLLERQANTFHNEDLLLSEKWDMACDYLEEDLGSGYVNVVQELIAAGWSNPAIRVEVRNALKGWTDLLTEAAKVAAKRNGGLGVFEPKEIAALVAAAFLGAEEKILLGISEEDVPLRSALRKIGGLIRLIETEE